MTLLKQVVERILRFLSRLQSQAPATSTDGLNPKESVAASEPTPEPTETIIEVPIMALDISLSNLKKVLTSAPDARLEKFIKPLQNVAEQFSINTPERFTMFIAQIAHESGEFRYMKEIWGPTSTQLKYEGRKDLGNTVEGDGKRFLGRGPIQITGRANYTECGKALGIDLISNPQLLEDPFIGLQSAGWFWSTRNLNDIADKGDFTLVTRRINGGTNGLEDRKKYYERAKVVFK